MTDTTQPLVIVKPEEISKAYELPDQKIAEIKAFCDNINIAGPEDKANYKTATAALSKVKKYRTGIEAKRKELKEPFLEAGKAIDAEAKRLTALIAPIEEALGKKIKVIDDAAHQAEMKRRENLAEQMRVAGFEMQSSVWVIGRVIISPQTLWDATPEQLEQIIARGLDERQRLESEAEEQRKKDEEIAALKAKIEEGKKAAGVVEAPTEPNVVQVYPNVKLVADPTMKGNEVRVETADPATFTQADMFASIPPVAPAQDKPQPPCTTTVFDYENGWNACKDAVLAMMRSDVKLTRQQWIENVEQLTPTK